MSILILSILGTMLAVGAVAMSYNGMCTEEWIVAMVLMMLGMGCFIGAGTLL